MCVRALACGRVRCSEHAGAQRDARLCPWCACWDWRVDAEWLDRCGLYCTVYVLAPTHLRWRCRSPHWAYGFGVGGYYKTRPGRRRGPKCHATQVGGVCQCRNASLSPGHKHLAILLRASLLLAAAPTNATTKAACPCMDMADVTPYAAAAVTPWIPWSRPATPSAYKEGSRSPQKIFVLLARARTASSWSSSGVRRARFASASFVAR